MNVAHSATQQAAKAGAGVHHAKGKAGLAGAGGMAGGDQGFMALFSAMEAGTDADADGLLGLGKDGQPALLVAGTDLGAAASQLPPADPLELAAQAALAASQAGAGVSGAAGAATAAATTVDAADTAAATAIVPTTADAGTVKAGQPAATDEALATTAGAADAAAVPAAVPRARAQMPAESDLMKALRAQLQAAQAAGGTASGTDAAGPSNTAQAAADGKVSAAGAATSAPKSSEVQLADSRLAAQLRLADAGRQADTVAQQTFTADSLMLAATVDGTAREAQRALERSTAPAGSATADTSAPGQGFAVTHGAIIEKPSASVDVLSPQATPDVQVAEQVSYWVSKDVQNAELKLDGLGGKPVEVSISVVGQEAHVEFRTDQAEIRQVLENAMPHLKEMLQSEGLTLSGTTVGTSAQGGQTSQEQRDRADARQARIALASLAPAQSAARAVESGMGGAVDYFV